MDGDIVRTAARIFNTSRHFTRAAAGRHEIDDTQELNIALWQKRIADLGFTGFIAHDTVRPEGHDALKSLDEAMES